ncbi:MAG: hypothetical protein ACLQU4_01030 [Limisphaerales bacterium]
MDSYKHSCPFCGQHIEYTAGYCGKQMICPICGKIVTFPAIPPNVGGTTLRIRHPEEARESKWLFDFLACFRFLAPLQRFKHWSMALVCLVPFMVVGALLVGASVVRKQFGSAPATPVAPTVQVDADAWQKMTDLARADQLVQQQLGAVRRATDAVSTAERKRAALHAYWHPRRAPDQSTYASVLAQYQAADQAVAVAQQALGSARSCFYPAFTKYQQLGGTIDYSRQLP